MTPKIMFYSGPHCHLCDLAQELMEQLPSGLVSEVEKVDIAKDHNAYHLYAVRIPVLKRADTDEELGWPFDLEQLKRFLS